MNKPSLLLALAAILPMSSASATGAQCEHSAEASRQLVHAFYDQALIHKQPQAAFERFVSPSFVEHKQDVAGGTRDEVASFLENLMSELPSARWEVVRTVAEPDFVALHARFVPEPGAPAYAIVDIFRIQDCRIVEHWDVVAPPRPPETTTTPAEQKGGGN